MSHNGAANCNVFQFIFETTSVEIPFTGITIPFPLFHKPQLPIDLGCTLEILHNVLYGFIVAILEPIIGLPTMTGKGALNWLVWTEATDQVIWGDLIYMAPSSFYWGVVIPVSIVLLLIATALVSIKAGMLGRYEAKRQFRRLGIAFLTIFFWLPIASTALKFFDTLAWAIVTTGPGGGAPGQAIRSIGSVLTPALVGGTGIFAAGGFIAGFLGTGASLTALLPVLLPLILLVLTLIIIPIFVMIGWIIFRTIIIVTLTVAMPIIAVFWAVDTFPFGGFSRVAERAAGAYPGLLISGLPPAFVYRLIYEVDDWGFGSILSALLVCGVFPLIIYIQIVTIRWAAGTAAEANVTQSAGQKVSRSGRQVSRVGRKINSSRASKTDLEPVDEQSVLEAVSDIEVSQWLTDGDAVVHEGPDAGTVHETFGIGRGRRLDEVDAYGVTLASVKALANADDETDAAVADLQRAVEDSAARVEDLTEESRRVREHSRRLSGRVDELEDRLDAATADNSTTNDDERDQ